MFVIALKTSCSQQRSKKKEIMLSASSAMLYFFIDLKKKIDAILVVWNFVIKKFLALTESEI